tara:strand:- start:98 stop:406 length:309 start_codon:yes stop_codon:yes gene_type:complete
MSDAITYQSPTGGQAMKDITVSVAEHDLENLIEAYHTLSDNADTLKAVNEEANEELVSVLVDPSISEVMEFAAGIMGQMLMRLEATGKISGPCLYSPEFTIN